MSTVPTSPFPIPDICPVPFAVDLAKAVVRASAREVRYPLWKALTSGISEAKEGAQQTGDVWPWEAEDEIEAITWTGLQAALEDAITSTVHDVPERVRLARAAARAYEALLATGTGRPVKAGRYGIRTCARPGCGQRFAAKNPRHIWHSSTCRSLAHKAARRAAEVTGTGSGTSPAAA